MPLAAIWHGSSALAAAFQRAIEHNCSCELDDYGAVNGRCPAHQSVLDQRFLDGVLFARWMAARLEAEEQRSATSAGDSCTT